MFHIMQNVTRNLIGSVKLLGQSNFMLDQFFRERSIFDFFSGYGLAFPKDSPHTTRFSLEILQLREEGAILYYQNYWFKTKGDCTPDLSILQASNGQLTLDDMIGVLYVVYCGIVVGLLCIVVEWCVASFWEVDPTDPNVTYFLH